MIMVNGPVLIQQFSLQKPNTLTILAWQCITNVLGLKLGHHVTAFSVNIIIYIYIKEKVLF